MISAFRVFHRESPDHKSLPAAPGFLHFGTCLRSIVLTTRPETPSFLGDYEVFEGREAYIFRLEVICGVRSALFGETEILGQFREFLRNNDALLKGPLRPISSQLIVDAKKIRFQHLQNLGSHSYGSLVRKKMESHHQQIHFVGSGQLTQEILPWLRKLPLDIAIYTRSPGKYPKLQASGVQVLPLIEFEASTADVVVIAAPIEQKQFQPLLSRKKAKTIFDLRGVSDHEPVQGECVYTLPQLFSEIETNQLQLIKVRREVEVAIFDCAQEKFLQEKPRPFGWDDLWAM